VLVLFNDPVPQEDHTQRAVVMALELRDRVNMLSERWRRRGHGLGFGMGIASGYATLGSVGFERRKEYSVIGTVPNLACRLCDEAKPGQILISQRVGAALEECVETEHLGVRPLKGFHKPVTVFELSSWRNPREATVQAGEAAP
jgi:class 3 adenylate cyclase